MPCDGIACRMSRRPRSSSCATGWSRAIWIATVTGMRPPVCSRPWRRTDGSAACSTASIVAGFCSVTDERVSDRAELTGLAPLGRAFYARPTTTVARELLGKVLVRQRVGQSPLVARIVEVEAYLGERDAASHARRGPTPRAAIMF